MNHNKEGVIAAWHALRERLLADDPLNRELAERLPLGIPDVPEPGVIAVLCDDIIADLLMTVGIENGEINSYGKHLEGLIANLNLFRIEH